MPEQAMSTEELRQRARERRELCEQIKQIIVERLDLPADPAWITDDQPLFGRGLELDSIDVLELAVGIDDVADVEITDEEVGMFGSINRVVDHIEAQRRAGVPAVSI